ncbi:hypothetical protein DITRI_Ditri04bG0111500 [Diplodiscus trichospermus]
MTASSHPIRNRVQDWRKLFAGSSDHSLEYYPPQISNGKIVVVPPVEIFEEGEDLWKNAVVAQFIDQVPNFSLFQRMLKILWKLKDFAVASSSSMATSKELNDSKTNESSGYVAEGEAKSVNRVAILNTVDDEENLEQFPSLAIAENTSRKTRVASAGVVELMKNLKTKRKGLIDKGEVKQALLRFDNNRYQPPKPFKFFSFWTKHADFQKVVKDLWELPAKGSPMKVLYAKMKRLKLELKKFNKSHFGDISSKVSQKRSEPIQVQKQLLNTAPNADLIEKEQFLSAELHDLVAEEESLFKQKSRVM